MKQIMDVEGDEGVTLIAASGRHISHATIGGLIRHVRLVAGDKGVHHLLDLAGVGGSAATFEDSTGWTSYPCAVALFDAAVEVTGDPLVARRVGADVLGRAGTEVAALLRSLGSPGEILRNVAATAGKYSTVTSMEAVKIGESSALISARTVRGMTRHFHLCRYTEGVLSQASSLFGMETADVAEVECQTNGHARCLYRVTWNPASGESDPQRRVQFLERELASMTERFEALLATSTELVAVPDVHAALDGITRRAGLAVRAPVFLLAVRVEPEDDLRVHQIGLTRFEAEVMAEEIMEVDVDDHDGARLVVDVATGGRTFGRLAAVYPDGGRFFPQERRLLMAYAAHAAAALAASATLEVSQRRDRTARVLLDLAHALSEVTTSRQVAARTADAALEIVDCDQSSVWLFSADGQFVHGATSGTGANRVATIPHTVTDADTPALGAMVSSSSPMFFARDISDPFMRGLLDSLGLVASVVVPIKAQGEFYGVVAAGVSTGASRIRSNDDLIERLSGLAQHAANALRTARLVDQMRHQAMHDPLTGLPNQRLLQERVERAVLAARRDRRSLGLLFVDLDGFKNVNDSFGHAHGDELLRDVADRMQRGLRETDSVARIGGDEFVVLLPNIGHAGEAEVVARQVLATMAAAPFTVAGTTIEVTASIGVSAFPEHGDTYDTLLKPADAAMYQAKAAGRATVVVAGRQSRRAGSSSTLSSGGSTAS